MLRSFLTLMLLLGVAAALAGCGNPPGSAVPASAPEGAAGEPGAPGEVLVDHSIHAGKAKMPCLSCHVYAAESPVAGLPSGRKCMGCHKFVAKEKPSIQLLAARVEEGTPLRWQRVFSLPEFIYFSHRVHVRAKVDCKECHGDMTVAKTIRQDRPFTMGFCLGCHEERKATRDCLACHK